MDVGETNGALPLLAALLATDSLWESGGGGHHRQLNTHWGAHQVPKGNSKPVVIKITLVKFSGPQNKRHEYGKETWETKGRLNRRRRWKG